MKKQLLTKTDKAAKNLERYMYEHGIKNQDDAINEILEGLYPEEG